MAVSSLLRTSEPLVTEAASSPARRTDMVDFDPDVMTMALQHGVLEHVQLERGLFRGQIAHSATSGSRLDWGNYELAVLARGDLSRDMVTIGLALTGAGSWRVHGQGADEGDIVVFPEGGEMLAALPRQAQWLSMQVPRSRIEAAGLCLDRHPAATRRITGELDAASRRALVEIACVLAPNRSDRHFEAGEVELAHEDLLALLLGEMARRGASSEARAPLNGNERRQVIRRAEAYLEARGEPSVRIDELCLAAFTSLSRLERAFLETFGVGPRRYLMLRRLAAVRRELRRGDPQTSITDVATRWGFFHLGRFSQEYRQLFLERPSETLRSQRPPASAR